MKEFNRYTVTSALPYVNGPIHFGHLVGCFLPADIYVRYLRGIGKEVLYVSGSDENGMAITLKALKEGIKPEDIINKYHPLVKQKKLFHPKILQRIFINTIGRLFHFLKMKILNSAF